MEKDGGTWLYGLILPEEYEGTGGDFIELAIFMEEMGQDLYYGECYQNNCYLTWWLDAGFEVVGNLKNRKYWEGNMYDSLLLEWHRE